MNQAAVVLDYASNSDGAAVPAKAACKAETRYILARSQFSQALALLSFVGDSSTYN